MSISKAPDASFKNVHGIVSNTSIENVHKPVSKYITNKYDRIEI